MCESFSVNSDITKTILTNSDLNNFVSEDKPRWGYGFNFTNSPFTAGCTVEYIPYEPDYGVQRVTQVQADEGTYKTAKRIKDNGTWSSWIIDNPNANVVRNTLVSGDQFIHFNQLSIELMSDGRYKLHFYIDGTWIGAIMGSST